MDRFNVAVKVVQNAGDLLRQCRLEEAEVSQKTGHQDLVTRWDRRIEQLLRNEILTAFPQDAIVGEEYPPEAHRTGAVTWYIDPIDGTTNFINQHQNYAISVGCWEGSVPLFGLVLDVERKALYWEWLFKLTQHNIIKTILINSGSNLLLYEHYFPVTLIFLILNFISIAIMIPITAVTIKKPKIIL